MKAILRTKWFLFGIFITLQTLQFADVAKGQHPTPSMGFTIIVTNPHTGRTGHDGFYRPPEKPESVLIDWLRKMGVLLPESPGPR